MGYLTLRAISILPGALDAELRGERTGPYFGSTAAQNPRASEPKHCYLALAASGTGVRAWLRHLSTLRDPATRIDLQ